jgi:hypothetical protein
MSVLHSKAVLFLSALRRKFGCSLSVGKSHGCSSVEWGEMVQSIEVTMAHEWTRAEMLELLLRAGDSEEEPNYA